jgi:hypothetical protein
MIKLKSVKVAGYKGRWTMENSCHFNGEKVYFMEHDIYGDDTCFLICKINRVTNELVAIAETYDDMYTTIINIEDYLI